MSLPEIQISKSYWQICLLFCLSAAILMLPELPAFADTTTTPSGSNNDAITIVLCNIVSQFQGPLGKGIATIAIIVLGVGLFLGKLSWAVAVATAIGIGMIFGAGTIVTWVASGTGSGGNSSCPTNTSTTSPAASIEYLQIMLSNFA